MEWNGTGRRLLLAVILLPGLAATAGAQADGAPGTPIPRWELGPYVGVARHSLGGHTLGLVPDRNHLFLGIHLTASLVRSTRWSFGYAPELVPLLVVSDNPRTRTMTTRTGEQFEIEYGSGPVAGFAVSPIGLEAQARLGTRWRPYVGGAAGVVWFSRAVPVIDARAFNYTFELGGGVRWRFHGRDSLRLGYKFHHLSNANSARSNPGLDGAVVLVGFERALGSRQ